MDVTTRSLRELHLGRRGFLALGAGAAVATAGAQVLGAPRAAAAELDAAPFTLGVASGDPRHDSVVLWTRLAPDPLVPGGGMPAQAVPVRWELSRDPSFRRGVRRGTATAAPQDAHSLRVEVGDLAPDRWYWYRFTALGTTSRVGRTRTMPAPGARAHRLRFAFVSCQAWVGGPYPAYRDLAEHDLDLVVHLGDYLYETANGSLEEFRRLHALYKTSPDLRAAHARFPFVTTWDDHEVQNNYAGPLPGAAGDGRPFLERRANAYQAYWEHLPLRAASEPEGPDMELYRRVDVGRLARISVLDTRQYRSDQPCGDGRREPCAEVSDPARTMTGPEQERWLLDGLSSSRAAWNVIAQQTIMAQFDYDLGPATVVNLDQWDGYPAARSRILGHVATCGVRNPVVLSGDWHTAWCNDLLEDFDDPSSRVLATEFVGTSVSSGAGWDADVRAGLPANPHVRFYEGSYRGWTLCDVTPERWRTTYRIVLDPRDPASPAYTAAVMEVREGRPGARRVDAGDGTTVTVTDAAGAGVPGVEVTVLDADGRVVLRRLGGAGGEVFAFVPPGSYAVRASAVGYEVVEAPLVVQEGRPASLALTAPRLAGPRATYGRPVPGPLAEAAATDVVLENEVLALALSAGSQDPQLAPATVGKPRDLAALGRTDQLDWMNLPYASLARPTGPNAWQQRTVLTSAVEVVSAGGPQAVVRATGAAAEVPALAAVTDFALGSGEPWVTATTTFTNTGAAPVAVWVGDVIDHDGTGQRAGVAGHGTVTAGPVELVPSGRWIGMTGTERQTYGIVHEDEDFVVQTAGIWVMTLRRLELAPGASAVLARKVVAAPLGPDDDDPWAPLAAL